LLHLSGGPRGVQVTNKWLIVGQVVGWLVANTCRVMKLSAGPPLAGDCVGWTAALTITELPGSSVGTIY